MKFTKKMNRKFGVEIELSSGDFSAMQTEISQYNQGVANDQRWTFKYEHCGREIVSPILQGKKGLEALETIMKIVKRNNGRVSTSCGLHVHLDITEWGQQGTETLIENAKRFTKLYAKYEDGIDSIMPESRKRMNNQFCYGYKRNNHASENMGVAGMFEKIDAISNYSQLKDFQNWSSYGSFRYSKVNWYAFEKHSTVEVRHHSATTQWKKLKNWVLFLLGFIAVAEKRNTIAPVNRQQTALGCTMTNSNYANERLDHQIDRMMKLAGADAEMKQYFKSRSNQMR